ncbi:MAG: M61 family peptidase [Terriglobales bacterium]|jgi:predicted metalloprotease with PDZ domain
MRSSHCIPAVFLILALPLLAENRLEVVKVDLSDARKNVIHAELTIPVKPGPFTLVYPKWIPGDHAPTGPIGNLAGLFMSANGRSLGWTRDPVDLYAFHVRILPGVRSLKVNLDFLAIASTAGATANASIATTEKLAILRWHVVLLYPAQAHPKEWMVQPSVRLPIGWQYASALDGAKQTDQTITFDEVTLEKLVDSPLIAGQYFRRFAIAPGVTPKHFLDIVADTPEDLVTTAEQEQALTSLVIEASALFGSHHFQHYDFLVALSGKLRKRTVIGGQEHHESSDDTGSENVFRSPAAHVSVGENLAHEYAHSWNGKYRRPIGQFPTDYQSPMNDQLLWVYEGLTEYVGVVLAARSGAITRDEFRDILAELADEIDNRSGREWKDLEDTSVSLPTLMNTGHGWDNWRRTADYYSEGALLWLEVDAKIRTLTNKKKSLDDFCRAFFGKGVDTGPEVVPYTFNQITAVLNGIARYDWNRFFQERLHSKSPHAPLDGIVRSGWTLAYSATPTKLMQLEQQESGDLNAISSAGFELSNDGTVTDVKWGSGADIAGLAPGMRILTVDAKPYSVASMRDAMDLAHETKNPIALTISNTGYERSIQLPCPEGQRYPHLQRTPGTPDLLDDIARPIASASR